MTGRPRIGERIYRALLRLFPTEYRQRFGEDMVQLYRDRLRDARAGGAPWRAAGAWVSMVVDLVTTAPSERLGRYRNVAHSLSSTPTTRERLLGIAGIVGGAVLLSAFLIDVPSGLNALRIGLFNAGAIAVVIAVMRRSVPISALAIGIGGMAILANGLHAFVALSDIHGQPPLWASVGMQVTTTLFGLSNLGHPGLTRWGAVALTIGGALAMTGLNHVATTMPVGDLTILNLLSPAGVAIVCAGWVLLGVDVATRKGFAAQTAR